MNNLKRYMPLMTVLLFYGQMVQAAPLTDFATGETLTATKMNEINNAVNSNTTSIGALESQSQNLAGGCPAGQYIRAVSENGVLSCETDNTGSADTLTGLSCSTDQVVKFNGTAWVCAEDNDTASPDTLSGLSCSTDQIAKFNGTTWVCAEDVDTDTNTTYSAGTGLTLSGTTFSLNSSNLVVYKSSDIGGGGNSSFTGSSVFELLLQVSTYSKISDTSTLLISYSDSLQTDAGTNKACTLAIRVNDVEPDGGRFAPPIYTTYLTTQTFFDTSGTFSGLSAGTYNINIYKRVLSSANCIRNDGNWQPTMTIREIEP